MAYATVRVEDAGGVRTITLHRPERRNAMTPEMQEELTAAMEAAAAEPGCRVVVFAGAGAAFCAGLDLQVLQRTAAEGETAEALEADARRIARLFRTLFELPKPTIAAVHGAAVAGGTGLATICDFTLAVPEARFGYTEVRIGFVPALVSAYLTLQVGDKRARGLLLTGRLFGAEEARELGLVTEVVEPERLAQRVRELAEVLVANSPESMAATKRLLAEQHRVWLDRAVEMAVVANAASRGTADFREGVAAFLGKRPPRWAREADAGAT